MWVSPLRDDVSQHMLISLIVGEDVEKLLTIMEIFYVEKINWKILGSKALKNCVYYYE